MNERYTVVRDLGRGAIGTVHAARDRSTGAVIALKKLDPALVSKADPQLAELFLKNARSSTRLRHRNIVQVHDAGEAGGAPYVAMELLEGESLRKMLEDGPLSIARAIRIFDDIASALAYAHEEKIVHRGVRPSSITVLPSGVAKIADFGIGQIGEAALPYKSPEQVRGGPVDHRSDIFSLGAVFYEMLTGRVPFEGKSAKEIQEKILRVEPPLPSKLNPLVPAALDEIVSRMLVRQPDQRFANLRLLLRDLQRVEDGLGLRPAASAVADPPPVRVPPPAVEPVIRREPILQPLPARTEPAAPSHAAEREPFYAQERFVMDREPRREERAGSRTGMLAALLVVLAVVGIGAGALYYSPEWGDLKALASRMQEAPAPAASPPPQPIVVKPAAPVAVVAKEPATSPPAAPAAVPAPPPLPVAEPLPPTSIAPAPVAAAELSTPAKAQRTSVPKPGGVAKVIIAISPRGELYIDGKHLGTTPPVTTLDLEPGLHRIEIRSGSRKPYLTYMTVEAGDERRIRHDFNAKPSAPPR